MALTQDQIDQAERLHGAIAWVYPDLSNAEFWDNYFNQTEPQLTPEEQASGISIGPAPSGYGSRSRNRGGSSTTTQPSTGGYTPQPNVSGLQFRDLDPLTFPGASNYRGTPQTVGANAWREPGIGPTDYQSNLIKALRAASGFGVANPGVSLLPNQAGASGAVSIPGDVSGLANNPEVLSIPEYDPAGLPPSVTTQPQQPDVLTPGDMYLFDPALYGGLVGGGN